VNKPREFWISQSKTWSDETKSYSIEKTSVDRSTEESAMRLVMEIGVGIRVIEYSAYEELRGALEKMGDASTDVFEQMLKGRWTDSEGHSVELNRAMLDLKNEVVAAMNILPK